MLPQEQKRHLRIQKRLRIAIEQEIYFVIIAILFFLALCAMYFLLVSRFTIIEGMEQQITQKEAYVQVRDMHQKFDRIDTYVQHLDTLHDDMPQWSQLFVLLSAHVPQNIVVHRISMEENHVSVHATAVTRDDIAVVKEKLRDVERDGKQCFTKIHVPEGQFAVPEDVQCDIEFDVQLDCLK